jgi:glycosyltransferase involved in cell wall biosynthesis
VRVLVIIEAFWPATEFGGPIRSSFSFCNHLAPLVDDLTVVTTNVTLKDSIEFDGRWRAVNGYRVFYAPTIGQSLFSPFLVSELSRQIAKADVVHLTGVYSWLLPFVARLCRRAAAVLVCAPRGTLFESARSQKTWRKVVFERAFLRASLLSTDALHATSMAEAEHLRRFAPGTRVLFLPNGVDVPPKFPDNGSPRRYFLYMGRLHPFKRIEMIISAFAAGPATINEKLELWIAGSGDPTYEDELRRFAAGASGRVRFLGHLEGKMKAETLRNAIALVLASKSESFGMAVAEALAHSVPCIVTSNVPWQGLNDRSCGVYVPRDDTSALAEAMSRFAEMSGEEIEAMGSRGREWMLEDYSWAAVAERARSAFVELVEARRSRH